MGRRGATYFMHRLCPGKRCGRMGRATVPRMGRLDRVSMGRLIYLICIWPGGIRGVWKNSRISSA